MVYNARLGWGKSRSESDPACAGTLTLREVADMRPAVGGVVYASLNISHAVVLDLEVLRCAIKRHICNQHSSSDFQVQYTGASGNLRCIPRASGAILIARRMENSPAARTFPRGRQ